MWAGLNITLIFPEKKGDNQYDSNQNEKSNGHTKIMIEDDQPRNGHVTQNGKDSAMMMV